VLLKTSLFVALKLEFQRRRGLQAHKNMTRIVIMLQTFKTAGLLNDRLFLVEGDLVVNYNRVLERAIGKKTALTAFHLDKRGESPELEAELGKNYLQTSPAHRYCIIVSPEQKDAGLIHEEFSFDHEILDFLYENYLPGISVATRIDGLYGELNDNVRAYEALDDLLLIKRVQMELHTPSGFLTKARELQGYVQKLRENPDLLLKDGSAIPKKILELVKEVGDVRNYNLSPIQATKEITTFFTRLFGGVCVFRDFESARTRIQIKRPNHESGAEGLEAEAAVAIENLPENLLMLEDSTHTVTPPLLPPTEQAPLKTMVIYQQKEYQPDDGPLVQFIPLQEKERVVRFLLEYGYAVYDYALMEARLTRLEDETLLAKGHAVTEMGREQRLQALAQYADAMLFEWYELKDIQRRVEKGYGLPEVLPEFSATTKSMLLTARDFQDDDVTYVVEHLLTRLYDGNYEKMYMYNRRHLERLYEQAESKKQQYILAVLTKAGGA
jgi:hypothetical protein